ncbi:DUF2982 domain-containing protein [Vibrio scophthalmi]|uniref:DUF2982 domain-containing protein n=1 Tax=Vibrio scophthalmi TaxID=45658 RepID=UPI002FF2E537
METQHLVNQPINLASPLCRVSLASLLLVVFAALMFWAPGFKPFLLALFLLGFSLFVAYWLILKSTVKYTLTSTHFQQHLFKGGWVVKWNNISRIGLCYYDSDGWQQPLPWIGIKLKHYSPYLTGVCPRIATEILLSQRALLYLGAKQHKQGTRFEEIVLDSADYHDEDGQAFTGLQAMLANRMRYQRAYYDYDIFISTQDLDRPADEFVGLMRRYLAAAEPE